MFITLGIIFCILGIIGLLVVFFVQVLFSNFLKKVEKVTGVKSISDIILEYLLGNVYLNIGLFLFLPAIVFFILGYFY